MAVKPSTAPDSAQAEKHTKASIWDLETQFSFYGQYHTQKVNVLVHVVCVPQIFFTALVLAHYTPFFKYTRIPALAVTIPEAVRPLVGGSTEWVPNSSTLTAFGYATYFLILEPIAGGLYWPLLMALGQWSDVLYERGTVTLPFVEQQVPVLQLAWIVFIAGWIAQFYGHFAHEGRAPALLDSAFQSAVLAVFFVWMEVLFYLGYRPKLHKRVQNRIGKAVLKFRQERARAQKGPGGVQVKKGDQVHENIPWRG